MALFDYYKSIGQALPSVQERAKTYESLGLGSAGTYTGLATQNNALESKLRAGSVQNNNVATPPTINAPAPGGTNPPQPSNNNYDLNAIVDAMMGKGYNNRAEAEAVAKGDPARFAREYLGVSSPGGGSSAGGTPAGGSSSINLEQKYKDLIAGSGISDIQKQVDDKNAEIAKLEKEAADQRATIGENPFLSEAALSGRIAKIDKKLKEKTDTLNNEISTLSGQITGKKGEINDQLGLTVQQFNIDKATRSENLQNFNNLLSSKALVNATAADIATLAQQTGLAPSFIQSAIQQSQIKEPQIITQTDDNGNVSIISIDKSTGDILKTVSAGKVGKDTSSGGGSTATTVKANFSADADSVTGQSIDGVWVGQFPQLVLKYAPYMSLEEIYKMYLTTTLGKKYGSPKENPADIKALYDQARGS